MLDAQVKKLMEHGDAPTDSRSEVEVWRDEYKRLKDKVENELWALYTVGPD